jgi:hypothetical protein
MRSASVDGQNLAVVSHHDPEGAAEPSLKVLVALEADGKCQGKAREKRLLEVAAYVQNEVHRSV